MRLLMRARCDRRFAEAIELALVAEGLALPRRENDLQRFEEARLTLLVRDTERVVRPRAASAACPGAILLRRRPCRQGGRERQHSSFARPRRISGKGAPGSYGEFPPTYRGFSEWYPAGFHLYRGSAVGQSDP